VAASDGRSDVRPPIGKHSIAGFRHCSESGVHGSGVVDRAGLAWDWAGLMPQTEDGDDLLTSQQVAERLLEAGARVHALTIILGAVRSADGVEVSVAVAE
jgi:hypothetical protein